MICSIKSSVIVLFILFILYSITNAQNVHRLLIVDADSKLPISNVSVYQINQSNAVIALMITDAEGQVFFDFNSQTKGYRLSHLSYIDDTINAEDIGLDMTTTVVLYLKSIALAEVKIFAYRTGYAISGDTTIYNAPYFMVHTDKNMLDVLNGIPGISIEINGTIRYKGKPVNEFRLEGNSMNPGDFHFWASQLSKVHLETINVITKQESEDDEEIIVIDLKIPETSKRKPVGTFNMEYVLFDKQNFSLAPIVFFDKSSVALKVLLNSVNIDYGFGTESLSRDLLASDRNDNFQKSDNNATTLNLPTNGVEGNSQYLVSSEINLQNLGNTSASIKLIHFGLRKELYTALDYYFFENNSNLLQNFVNKNKLRSSMADIYLSNEKKNHRWSVKLPLSHLATTNETEFSNTPIESQNSVTTNKRLIFNPKVTSNYRISDRIKLISELVYLYVDKNLGYSGVLPNFFNNDFFAYNYAYSQNNYNLLSTLYYSKKDIVWGAKLYARSLNEFFRNSGNWNTFRNMKVTPSIYMAHEANGYSISAGISYDIFNKSHLQQIDAKHNFFYPYGTLRKKFNSHHTAFLSYFRNVSLYDYEKLDTSFVFVDKIFSQQGLIDLNQYSLMNVYNGGYVYFNPDLGYFTYNLSWLHTKHPLNTTSNILMESNILQWLLSSGSKNLNQRISYRTKLIKNFVFLNLNSNLNYTVFDEESPLFRRMLLFSNIVQLETRYNGNFNFLVGYQHNMTDLSIITYGSKLVTHSGLLGVFVKFGPLRLDFDNKLTMTSFGGQNQFLANLNGKIQYILPKKAGCLYFKATDYTNLNGRNFSMLDINANFEVTETYKTFPGYFSLGYELML